MPTVIFLPWYSSVTESIPPVAPSDNSAFDFRSCGFAYKGPHYGGACTPSFFMSLRWSISYHDSFAFIVRPFLVTGKKAHRQKTSAQPTS